MANIYSESVTTYQNAADSHTFAVYTRSASGSLTATDLDGKTVVLVVFDPDNEASKLFEKTGSVGGSDNNEVTVEWDSDDAATVDVYHYVLRNTTDDDAVVGEGTFHVKRAASAS